MEQFQTRVWQYYTDHRRDMPWRHPEPDGSFDPYKILISEVMLQQTQVSRVIPKYRNFVQELPSLQSLAHAPLSKVLQLWSGLGYNRRAKYLHEIAQEIERRKVFPKTKEELTELPGIGDNTAAAILVYTYNQPHVFIETNIRTAYIYGFFRDEPQVTDAAILPILEQTLDTKNPREWYWALMDYGAHIKATQGNLSRNSAHFVKQSRFHGSRRQIRGQVLRELQHGSYTQQELTKVITDTRLPEILIELEQEGLVARLSHVYRLPD